MERQGGERGEGGGQCVFVKRLNGALMILAERGPLMAGIVLGRPREAGGVQD